MMTRPRMMALRYGGTWLVAALLCVRVLAQEARATDLTIDFYQFGVRYLVDGVSSPHYHVQHGDPHTFTFNQPATALLLPYDVERFGAEVELESAGPTPVYPALEARFYDLHGSQIGPDLRLCRPLLAAGMSDLFGITPVYRGKMHLVQPTDLPEGDAVRMALTVRGFSDAECQDGVADAYPDDNTVHFWIMRASPLP